LVLPARSDVLIAALLSNGDNRQGAVARAKFNPGAGLPGRARG